MGINQFDAYNMFRFEDEIGLKDMLKPLVTSYTSSANADSQGGRPSYDGKNIVQKDNGTTENRTSKENN
mgnify:CR=1 FL=1